MPRARRCLRISAPTYFSMSFRDPKLEPLSTAPSGGLSRLLRVMHFLGNEAPAVSPFAQASKADHQRRQTSKPVRVGCLPAVFQTILRMAPVLSTDACVNFLRLTNSAQSVVALSTENPKPFHGFDPP